MRVALYVADGCGLRVAAREAVESVCVELGVEYAVIGIDGNDELERRYRVSLPVVEVDGVRRFEFFVEPHELRASLIDA